MDLIKLRETYIMVSEHIQEHNTEGVDICLEAVLSFSGAVSNLIGSCEA